MENTRPYWKVIVSLAFSMLATILIIVGGAWLLKYLIPFVIGWLIACVANPMVCWLNRKLKMKKKLGSAIVIVFVLAVVIGVFYLGISFLVRELMEFADGVPALYEEVARNVTNIMEKLPEGVKNSGSTLLSKLGGVLGELSKPAISAAGDVAMQIPSIIIGTFVTILSAYFFVADRDEVLAWLKKVTPKPVGERISIVIQNFKQAVGGYFKAQFKIMIVVFAILAVGLGLLGVEYVILISLLVAFLDFLPFFGTGAVFIPWCIYTIFMGDYLRAIYLFVIYATTQIVRQLIQPKLVGDSVGLKPLPTLLFIYIGYKMGGFLWMILAVPIGMIIINMVEIGAFDYIINDVKILVDGVKKLKE